MSVNFDEQEAIGTSPIPATSLNHVENNVGRTHSQMLGKFEYTGGPIFKVVLEC